jgi:Xaa-Pro aminopeptidase
VSRRPEADHYARRRAALAAAFPGETLVVPTGREKTRANDAAYPFRPGSDFMWLTGEHDPESVLVIGPDGAATLYIRPRSPRNTDEFFRNAVYGELWIGRRHTLEEKAAELGLHTRSLATWARRWRCASRPGPGCCAATTPPSTRDPLVRHRRARHPRPRAGHKAVRAAPGQGRLGGGPAAGRHRRDVRGFEDVARILPADRIVAERLLEGIFGLRARHDGNDLGYSSIVGAGAHATTLHWIRNTGATRRASCC